MRGKLIRLLHGAGQNGGFFFEFALLDEKSFDGTAIEIKLALDFFRIA